MKLDVDSLLGHAEDFLRRHIKSKAVREAEKRRRQRQLEEAKRRLSRAVTITGASGATVVGYTFAVAPAGTVGLIAAGGATLAAATAALFWPTRRHGEDPRALDLDLLPAQVEEWLLARRTQLPPRTAPTLDAILQRLHDIQPFLARIDPHGPLAGEARRLIGGHLPRLVDTYLELPATMVERRPEVVSTLVDSLGTVAEELARLCEETSRESMHSFETQGRFIETRYRDRGPFGHG